MFVFDDARGLWRHKETAAAGQTSTPLICVPGDAAQEAYRAVTVGVSPSVGASALVQFTLDDEAAITANTAEWFDWPNGPVTAKSFDSFITPCTALRLTATGGAVTWWALV
ncbi:hypothetical protein HZB60_04145 [candidate division KSB1 bacterium]|nr:hypothetical protein [candidate division KSB1 bacterium]